MRNFKKFLALVLATLMVISAAATVSAYSDVADDNTYAAAINALTEYKIVNGTNTELDTFSPDDSVVRYQMALMMARALEPKVTDWQEGLAVFTDVTEWYGAIAYAYTKGIVTGIGGGQFAPKDGIKYQDALIMAVRALGYEIDTTKSDPYWIDAYKIANEIGLTNGVKVTDPAKTLTRAETAQVIYNMLKATPADGGATIEAKNFGAATAENTTTFVLTATENQAYMSNAVSEAGYVGIQALVNGIPSGDIVYVPATVLGIDADKVDDYFGYSFDLVNYDAATKKFDKAIIGLDPVVAYNADVTVNSSSKVTYDKVAYVTVDSFTGTGAGLRNELVIFQGGELAKAAKMLLTDKDGNIVNYNREILATFAYETATGAKYYVYEDVTTGKATVVSEAVALEKFGVEIGDDSYVEYKTMQAGDLEGNYQITLFDDDRDGKFERAIVTPVYLSAYKAQNNGAETFGPKGMNGVKGVTYTEKLTKGQLFTYTFNAQTKVVTVLNTYAAQTGTLTRINTVDYNKDGKWATVLTIDGKQYTLGNVNRENKGLTGATIPNKAEGTYDKVADSAVNYYYDAVSNGAFANGLTIGSPIRFYALDNGTLITAKTYSIEEAFEYAVLNEINSYDNENVYVDLYLNGKIVKDAAVSKINGQTLSELNIFQLSRLLGNEELFATGNIFRAVKLADGSYQLSEILERTDAKSLNAFKLTHPTFGTKITFVDGIADVYNDNGIIGATDSRIIRTTDSTVFYFLKKSANGGIESISTFVGMPDNSSIDFSDRTVEVYTDKIGYTGDFKGKSSVVFVYYTDANAIKGFGVANVEFNTAYIFGKGESLKAYNSASAADLGLIGTEYAGKYFYEYNVTAIDMANGNKITKVYYEKALSDGQFVTISADGVVLSTNVAVNHVSLTANSFTQGRYYVINGVTNANGTDKKITTVKLTSKDGYDVKTDNIGAVIKSTHEVYYIDNFEDGSFVGVVANATVTPAPDGTVTIVSNAKWFDDNAKQDKAANFAYDIKDGKVVGSFTLTNVAWTSWTASVTTVANNFGVGTYTVENVVNVADNSSVDVNATCAVANGKLNVTISKVAANQFDTTTFAKGDYTAEIHVGNDIIYFGFSVK